MPGPADGQGTFQQVLAAAINDLVENGFDSAERVARWTRLLRLAAERSLVSAASLEQQLRDGLAAIYRRMVDQGGVLRFNAGVERFTLQNIKPKLRAELDKRIMASAELIKLNRREAIDKTLRRFQGWSTSIPAGGTDVAKRRETKESIRKAMASLPFEERRVLIDQGHKLTSAISEIVASDGGAIAGTWRSNWRQPGYDYREPHKDRDGQVYLVRGSWAHTSGLVKPGTAGYVDASTKPGEEVFCRCYYRWLYSLRELPDDMLTSKGKVALVNAKTAARADSDENYSAKYSGAVPLKTDRGHDVVGLAAISEDGTTLYIDRGLPLETQVGDKRIDPAALLLPRELSVWISATRARADFIDQHLRHPDDRERAAIDADARKAAEPAERAAAKREGVEWRAWEVWCRSESARLARQTISRVPPDLRTSSTDSRSQDATRSPTAASRLRIIDPAPSASG